MDRRNLLPQLFRGILATVCCSGINLRAIKAPQQGHHGLRHYLYLKNLLLSFATLSKMTELCPFRLSAGVLAGVPSVAPET